VDVSVLVSSLIGRWSHLIADAADAEQIELYVSAALLEELDDVLRRPRIQMLISEVDRFDLGALLRERSTAVDVDWVPDVCRDPDDNYLLGLAAATHADYLVTRDEDLLSLEKFRGTEIVYPARFLRILRELAGAR